LIRIGLIRHFPVEESFPSGWKTAAELQSWRQKYDASPAIVGQSDLGSFQWSECISSDLERALTTARKVFNGNIEKSPLLREAEFAQFQTGNLRLPVFVWHWALRFCWMTGHKSQRACRDDFRSRVAGVADLLEAKAGNILVVSHAGMMAFLSAELRRRRFIGPKLKIARHATLYIYERSL
jgi:broad specificity phosphatase PhoE